MKFNELTKGMKIEVQSATNDFGKTDDPNGWWGASYQQDEKGPYKDLSHKVLKKIVKEKKYKTVKKGFENGECLSTITKIEII